MPDYKSEAARKLYEKLAPPPPAESVADKARTAILAAANPTQAAAVARSYTANVDPDPAKRDQLIELLAAVGEATEAVQERWTAEQMEAPPVDSAWVRAEERRRIEKAQILEAGGEPILVMDNGIPGGRYITK